MGEDIGTLVIVVLKARNLRDRHTFYKQDVYAQAALNKETKKTRVDVKGGQHPVWDEELRFPVMKGVSDETRKLEVSCWSKEPRTDECVGRGTVDITETLKTGEFDDWVPLKMEDGAYRGELYLEMTYYAKTPPLQRRASKWKPSERLNRPNTTYAYADIPALPTVTPDVAAARHHGVTSAAATRVPKPDYEPLPLPGYSSHTPHGSHPAAQIVSHERTSPPHKHEVLPPLPEEADNSPASIPAILRPGGGVRTSPRTSPKAGGGLLPPEHPLHTRAPVPPRDPSPPTESIPPYLRPGASHTPIPEPQIPAQQAYAAPVQPYAAPTQPYTSAQPYAPPPQTYPSPPPQQYVAPPQPYGSSSPPQTTVPPARPYQPTLQTYASSHPPQPYGSPPGHYAPPHAYIPPSGPPAQPYPPYGYAPPRPAADGPAGTDLPDPYLQARYKTPLPLPSEPPGTHTPTPAHPRPRESSPPPPPKDRHASPPPPPKDRPASRSPVRQPARTYARGPSREEEERDRLLALALEKEEEERQRKLREQEERDSELARQLDLELNPEQEEAARRTAEREQNVPGGWQS